MTCSSAPASAGCSLRDTGTLWCRDRRRRVCSAAACAFSLVLCVYLCEAFSDFREGFSKRKTVETPFLTQDELLYLVLLIFEYEISYTVSGGYTTLHRLRDQEQAQFVDELFKVPLLNRHLSLHESCMFNEYLEQHDSSSIKCPTTPLNYYLQTNKRHVQLRQCVDALREKIGWDLSQGHEFKLRPLRETLLGGFFLAHMDRVKETFLNTLFDTNWTSPEHTSYEHAI
jgi:hypothetical protein